MPEAHRVVFDCNIFHQAAISAGGPAAACLREVEAGSVTLLMSAEVWAEISDVLSRPHLTRKFATLTPERIARFLGFIERSVEWIVDVPRCFALPRDPKDEPYVNLAIAARAGFLVSRDRDLLDLMGDVAFRERAPGLRIVDPATWLRERPLKGEEHAPGEPAREEGDPDDASP
jgi:putative PIN family toxin of toxin-antitoxin system